ncbi:glycosyltransferase family 4 protein [Sphaerochaeta sp.]|uniref:glycosyltransferase family 4 protein n=1 Tax=Sphaerochaeta sp. TaxID=1972642 RepID=UPI002FC91F1F
MRSEDTRSSTKHIGIVHFKTGDTDGVSLEIDKWTSVFQKRGYKVFLCSGKHGRDDGKAEQSRDDVPVTIIEELDYHGSEAARMQRQTFVALAEGQSEAAYSIQMLEDARIIQQKVEAWIRTRQLDIVIVQNIWSVGLHPAAAIAVEHALCNTKVRVVAQHHDFYWERVQGIQLSCASAIGFTDMFLPPHTDGYTHVVINSLAKNALKTRKGIDAIVIPNVFDFEGNDWVVDSWNVDFRETFKIKASDIVVLQATRVIPRKGIELAIECVAALNRHKSQLIGKTMPNNSVFHAESRIILVLAGYTQDDTTNTYMQRLEAKANAEGVVMLAIGDRITRERTQGAAGKTYSLWDAYVHADIVTYPSYWEGWGNQFLEAVKARLPVVLFAYPVYLADIAPMGYQVISLGSAVASWSNEHLARIENTVLETAAASMIEVLVDRQKRESMVESNYSIAKKHSSLKALESHLEPILASWS